MRRLAAAPSVLRDERTAGLLGVALGVSFAVCFATGLISHLLQHPEPWFHWPARPVNLYRVTQGVHVLTGVVTIPLLLAKLWVVYPKLWAWPPVRGAVHALERMSLVPLVGGALFLLFSGVANIAYWYSPMPFFFPAAHYWVAWLTIGALLVHIGAKASVTRRAVFTPADPTARAPAPAPGNLSRRAFLATVGGTSLVLFGAVGGETLPVLDRLAALAPRRSRTGPQHLPVNRSATEARVVAAATDPTWRLELSGRGVSQPLRWSLADLRSMPQRRAGLPITCVEGWSAAARWEGVRLCDLLRLAGLKEHTAVRVESLERGGLYAMSVLDADHVSDPDTLVALGLNGSPLDLDHGYPARLIAPDRPGVLQTKWLARVVVL